MNGTAAVEVTDLVKHYGATRAVDGISLSIGGGEVFGLLGPNGAGKTSTVEILEGYRRPDSGSVLVLGLDPIADGTKLRPRIGVMLQEGGLYPGIRPLEALELFASYYENPDDPARLLSLVGLDDARGTLVRRLSGGQAQRLSLALCLIGRPELVFLDEPTAGMDPHARATTWQLVRTLSERGVTVLITTHAMDEAEQLCDRVAIIDHGRVVACDAPGALTNTHTADTVQFRARAGLDTVRLAAALGLAPETLSESAAGAYLIDAPNSPELVANLTAWLRDQGEALGELRAGRSSLEEVFLKLTGEGRA